MQGVASLVVMPHKTTDARCSLGPAPPADVGAGEKSPASASTPTTEGKMVQDSFGNIHFVVGRCH